MSYSFNIHFLSTGSAFATGHVFIELSDGQSRIAFELNANQNYMGPSQWMLGRNPVPTSFLQQQFSVPERYMDGVVKEGRAVDFVRPFHRIQISSGDIPIDQASYQAMLSHAQSKIGFTDYALFENSCITHIRGVMDAGGQQHRSIADLFSTSQQQALGSAAITMHPLMRGWTGNTQAGSEPWPGVDYEFSSYVAANAQAIVADMQRDPPRRSSEQIDGWLRDAQTGEWYRMDLRSTFDAAVGFGNFITPPIETADAQTSRELDAKRAQIITENGAADSADEPRYLHDDDVYGSYEVKVAIIRRDSKIMHADGTTCARRVSRGRRTYARNLCARAQNHPFTKMRAPIIGLRA